MFPNPGVPSLSSLVPVARSESAAVGLTCSLLVGMSALCGAGDSACSGAEYCADDLSGSSVYYGAESVSEYGLAELHDPSGYGLAFSLNYGPLPLGDRKLHLVWVTLLLRKFEP